MSNVSSALALIGDTFQASIGIWKCWFLRRGENWSTQGKTSRSREENQQQTQPTYDAGSENQTWDTLVGGEHSHHCAIPAPHYFHNTSTRAYSELFVFGLFQRTLMFSINSKLKLFRILLVL